ncbi:MAG: DUF333 domain-containing protein [Thiothrix sp.]|jgi:uncharacterized protein|uniref:putative hemolysin n=1 Tax=Thiothrix sp. TaxID=1032 RepID=UPI002633CF4D|nr:DUF333 domain-containing protein [Thiothrix sp.]MDD5392483.1 DUF333 domain-containing protein [Thiothrix sp.]
MKLAVGFVIALSFALSACTAVAPPMPTAPVATQAATRATNPASMNCIQNHGKLEIVQTPEGEKGECVLPSGKRCDEWEMFRGNCPTRTVNVGMKKFGL